MRIVGEARAGMSVMFNHEIVADDNMHVCPHNRLEWGTFDGMSLTCPSKILEKLLPQVPFFFSIYLLQVEDRSDITTNFRTENNHIGYYPWRSII